MLKIRNLNKRYNENIVFENFSLDIKDTGITAIMGASGIGKTTLLNIIAGLIPADSAEISSDFSKISYKFQEPRLFPWLTALENVKIADSKMPEQTAAMWLNAVGLEDDMNKYPYELSGGMCQRVALARSLAHGGDLLLLDEPFSAVDIEMKEKLIKTVKEYGRSHAVIVVTHDIEEAEMLGADIISI